MLAPAILALAVLQEDAQPSASERLDACIARARELQGFEARYHVESSGGEHDGEEGVLELAYEAPGRGAVRMHDGEVEFDILLGPDGIHARIPDGGGVARWRKGTFRDPAEVPAWRSELDERFPSTRPAGAHGMTFELRWNGMRGVDGFEVSVQSRVNGATDALAWLPRMLPHADEMSVAGDVLLWEGEEFRCELSLDTGFPLRLEAKTASGGRIRLELLELVVDDVSADAFELPDEALAAEETPQFTSMDPAGPQMGRVLAFFRVGSLVHREERAWDESAREDFVAVLAEVHHELVTTQLRASVESLRAGVERLGEHVEQRGREAPPPDHEELEELVQRERTGLVEALDRNREKYVASIPAGFGPFDEGVAQMDYLFEAERDGARVAYDAWILAPVLECFDERMERALEGD